ncbi:MAG: hypothetical protein AAGM33_02880 [Pseudomonadota bacterium]
MSLLFPTKIKMEPEMKARLLAGVLVICSLSNEAHAAKSSVQTICTSLKDKTLTVTVQTGCLRSGQRTNENSLALDVDQSTATIRIDGDFSVQYGYHIGSADCMGSTQFAFEAEAVEARRYNVMFGDRMLGQADFIADGEKAPCFNMRARAARHPAFRDRDFADWSTDLVTGWRDWRGDDLPALLAPLVGSFPDIMEGEPALLLSAAPARWFPSIVAKPFGPHRQHQQVMAVELTQRGLGDDSVSAMRFFGIAGQGDKGWHFKRLFAQAMCARGPNSGQWSASRCP